MDVFYSIDDGPHLARTSVPMIKWQTSTQLFLAIVQMLIKTFRPSLSGGSVYAGLGFMTPCSLSNPDVAAICTGMAASMGAVLGGQKGSAVRCSLMMITPGFLKVVHKGEHLISNHIQETIKLKEELYEIGSFLENLSRSNETAMWHLICLNGNTQVRYDRQEVPRTIKIFNKRICSLSRRNCIAEVFNVSVAGRSNKKSNLQYTQRYTVITIKSV
jgi:hypothetical protein